MNKATTFLDSVIQPVLDEMGKPSQAAAELLLGTAVQESLNFQYRRQMNGGPARGYYQMEPNTHDDIWQNYLRYRSPLAKLIEAFLNDQEDKLFALENNDRYATAMARIHYMRVPDPLPKVGDIEAQARYWKKFYNTPLGAGQPHEFIEKWNLYVKPEYA